MSEQMLDQIKTIEEQSKVVLSLVISRIDEGKSSPNIIFTGKPGTGKTFLMKELERKFNSQNIKTYWLNIQFCVYDPETHLLGTTILRDKETIYVPSPFINFLEEEGQKVLFIDEINRATPEVLDMLLPLCDFRKEFYTRWKNISAGNITVIATMNDYNRTLDNALSDRFIRVNFKYPDSDVFFNSLRKKLNISIRTEQLAKELSGGDKNLMVALVKSSNSFKKEELDYIDQCALTL